MYVAVKDSIFQPSSALRHATENSHLIGSSGKAIVASITDGGSNHNVRHGHIDAPLERITITRGLVVEFPHP